jgi:hypothetical protein
MTIRAAICVGLAGVFCGGGAACSDEATDADAVLDAQVPPSDDASPLAADTGALTASELAVMEAKRGCYRGRITPPSMGLGLPCDLGSGQGACTNGGTVSCGGTCQPTDPAIGDATAWHIVPAPNGSWDWDCDGSITMTLVPTQAPPECSAHANSQSCNDAPTVEYVTESSPCGAQATLFKRDCDWKTLGPTCLDAPDGHRVVFQQCR